MILQNEVNILKIKSQKAHDVTEKCREEYFSVVKDVSELQKSFGFLLNNKTYNDGFVLINEKYNELLLNQKITEEIQQELNQKMHVLVLQKRKIDHLKVLIQEQHFSELHNDLDG